MAARRRRSKSWSKRLRRRLIQHRFSVAEAALGMVALSLGLWLLWPAAQDRVVEQRSIWEQSLSAARETERLETDPGYGYGDSFVSVARASVSVSAKWELGGALPLRGQALPQPHLDQVAATMPEIGPPGPGALAGRMPATALEPAALTTPNGEERELAALTAPRRAPAPGHVPAWLRNAVASPPTGDRPLIALVLDDLGMNRRNTAALNRLPGPLTLAFLPYAGELEQQARAGRAAGHELLLHVPMEPDGDEWPGPDALLTSLSPEEFDRRLIKALDSFTGFVGVNNHMGSRLTAARGPMARILAELRRRELLFLDSKTSARSVGALEARRHAVPYAQRDIFLDNEVELGYVMRQLRAVEHVAEQRGMAIAIGHPHDVTIEALRRWLPQLEARGFALVPLSTIVARQACVDAEIMVAACPLPGGAVGAIAGGLQPQRS
jgi:hypothetical protein